MLRGLEGVEAARVDGANDRAIVVHDARTVGVEAMVDAVRDAGFEATAATAPAPGGG